MICFGLMKKEMAHKTKGTPIFIYFPRMMGNLNFFHLLQGNMLKLRYAQSTDTMAVSFKPRSWEAQPLFVHMDTSGNWNICFSTSHAIN